MSRKKALDVEDRTLLIRLWKAGKSVGDIAYILNVSRGPIDRGLQELRASGLIDAKPGSKKKSKLSTRPKSDNKDPRHNRAMRTCLRCSISFNSSHCGNRLCKNCLAAASGGRAIK